MENIITATYEELTKEEIAEIISENFQEVKEVNKFFKQELLTDSRKRSAMNGLRETGKIMNAFLNLAEDLGLELEE